LGKGGCIALDMSVGSNSPGLTNSLPWAQDRNGGATAGLRPNVVTSLSMADLRLNETVLDDSDTHATMSVGPCFVSNDQTFDCR